jgi:hypothetical protein
LRRAGLTERYFYQSFESSEMRLVAWTPSPANCSTTYPAL